MQQTAPDPQILFDLVEKIRYKPGWHFSLEDRDRGQGSKGLTLSIIVRGPNSRIPGENISVVHYMIVPPASYNEKSWRRWLFEQCLLVERHEAGEFFQIGEERPFAPLHGPGNDPYFLYEMTTEEEIKTNFRGGRDD